MQGETTFHFVTGGIHVIVLGAGERLFEDVGDPRLEPVEVTASPAVTHVRHRVRR
jgi:hypothetical protein